MDQKSCSSTTSSVKVTTVLLYGVPIVALIIEEQKKLCLAQISNTLLSNYSYNEIHNRRVALGIRCVQCTPVQLDLLRQTSAMPANLRRCGLITYREAERLCKSFLGGSSPPRLPENFDFEVYHECGWGCRGYFCPSRYNSSRAKCIRCFFCSSYLSPNKFVFHSHQTFHHAYAQPDAANFNSWRRHVKLVGNPSKEITFAWEDVKAMFNGGSRKRNAVVAPSCYKFGNMEPKLMTSNTKVADKNGNAFPEMNCADVAPACCNNHFFALKSKQEHRDETFPILERKVEVNPFYLLWSQYASLLLSMSRHSQARSIIPSPNQVSLLQPLHYGSLYEGFPFSRHVDVYSSDKN